MNERTAQNASAFIKVQVLDWVLFTYFIMKKLIPFTPQGCDKPVALVSPNLPDFIKDVITENWDKSSSGLGDHYYVDSETITDPDELQEYWEEYQVQRDAEDQILTLSLFTFIIMFKYEVRCPAAPFENTAFARLDDCWSLCLDLSEEYGYAEVMYGRCCMGSYTNGA